MRGRAAREEASDTPLTDERIAVEALGRCTFSPGTWDKKFARSLAGTAEDYTLTPKQRMWLWQLVKKYRRQLPSWLLPLAKAWLAVGAEERALRNTIEAEPLDLTPRNIYADWLDERGREDEANVQRWMTDRGYVPKLIPCGQSYGPGGTRPINFEWTFGMAAWQMFGGGSNGLAYHHRSMEKAEAALGKLLSKQKATVPV